MIFQKLNLFAYFDRYNTDYRSLQINRTTMSIKYPCLKCSGENPSLIIKTKRQKINMSSFHD